MPFAKKQARHRVPVMKSVVFFSVVVLEWLAEKLLVREIPFRDRPGSGRQCSTTCRRSDLQRMKKGDHRPRNSAQYERVVELLILHKAKWTPRQISLLPSVSRPRSIIRQLRKSLTFFTATPVFYRFRGGERKRRVQLSVCDDSGEMPC